MRLRTGLRTTARSARRRRDHGCPPLECAAGLDGEAECVGEWVGDGEAERDGETECDGETERDGDTECEGEAECDAEVEGDGDPEADDVGEPDCVGATVGVAVGIREADGTGGGGGSQARFGAPSTAPSAARLNTGFGAGIMPSSWARTTSDWGAA
jgi:hypothetical protein